MFTLVITTQIVFDFYSSYYFQGASASCPSFYCTVKLNDLKTHGERAQEHNFLTSQCRVRDFDQMKAQLAEQIKELGEDQINVENFSDVVSKQERHDIERLFRVKGKNHESVVGVVNTGVESMDYVTGGPLHNEIGICNNILDQLLKELSDDGLTSVCSSIKSFLNASKAGGGAGCTPGHHHGGKYNGKL